MKVCIPGGRGRGHALAWIADKFGHEVYVVPDNVGVLWLRPGRAVRALRWGGIVFIAADVFLLSRTPHGG